MRFGLGFAAGVGLLPNDNTIFWGGYGGSLAIIDLDARTTIACTPNRMTGGTTGDPRVGPGPGVLGLTPNFRFTVGYEPDDEPRRVDVPGGRSSC